MVTDSFHDFFVASAGVSGALIGLLFVATAIAPERIVSSEAPAIAQETAAGAFLVLSNTLFVALSALIPEFNVGNVAIVVAIGGVLGTIMYAANSFYHRGDNPLGTRWAIRRLTTLGLLSWQIVLAFQLLNDPTRTSAMLNLALLNLVFYVIGLSRAWELLGGKGHGISDMIALWREEGSATAQRNQSSNDPV